MFKVIDIEGTPNPDALKFVLNGTIVANGVRQFDSAAAAESDELAAALFKVNGVQSVFYMGEFVTVTKDPSVAWRSISDQVRSTIERQGATAGGNGQKKKEIASTGDPEQDELLRRINQVLDETVRPALAGDGGGLEVVKLDGHVLTIFYQGACGSCPSATSGTMMAVQNLLQRMVDPSIRVVLSD